MIDSLTIDPDDNPDRLHTGFDLDGYYSTDIDNSGCTHQDFFSATDDDQHCANVGSDYACRSAPGCSPTSPNCRGGVDNQLPTTASTLQIVGGIDARAQLDRSIATHRDSLLVRVATSRVGSVATATVFLYVAFPTFDTDCDRVLPGREYSVARSSLVPGGATLDAAAAVLNGSLREGRISVGSSTPNTLALRSDLLGVIGGEPWIIHGLRLAFDPAPSELTRGVMCGWANRTEFTRVIDAAISEPYGSAIVSGIADLRDCQCAGDPDVRSDVGRAALGWGFHAVPAVISTSDPVVDAPRSGTCGAR